jgi:hypothetical protein
LEKLCSESTIFPKKREMYHAAAGESGHYRAQTPSLPTHRVSPVNDFIKRSCKIPIFDNPL